MWAVHDIAKTRLLLDRGADVNARSDDGRTPLLIAAGIPGGAPVVQLLLERGANPSVSAPGLFANTTPLAEAAYAGDEAIFRVLVERGADVKAAGPGALGLALRAQCMSCVETLLKALDPGAITMTMVMAAPPLGPALATNLLLDRGADIRATDPEGRTMLMLAAASDALPVEVVRTLLARGADVNAKSARGETALGLAKLRGNTPVVDLLIKAGATDAAGPPGPAAAPAPAASLRAMQVYAPASARAEYQQAVRGAAAWLEKQTPATTEERAFHLLGLAWGEASRTLIQQRGRALVAEQRPDGGWAQTSWLASDGYATGQALVALAESGALSVADPAYTRGVQFLMNTQFVDGSWFVRTRALPIQPHFESGFPYGRDQFISAAATNWAARALALAYVPPS